MTRGCKVKNGSKEKELAFFSLPTALSRVIKVIAMAIIIYDHIQIMIPPPSCKTPCSFYAHSTGHIILSPPAADISRPLATASQTLKTGTTSSSPTYTPRLG